MGKKRAIVKKKLKIRPLLYSAGVLDCWIYALILKTDLENVYLVDLSRLLQYSLPRIFNRFNLFKYLISTILHNIYDSLLRSLVLIRTRLAISTRKWVDKIKKYKKKYILIKIAKLRLEKVVFIVLKINTLIALKKVFDTVRKQELRTSIPTKGVILRSKKLFFFNDFLNIMYFTIIFKKSDILTEFISRNITNKKMHFNFLKKVKRLIYQFFYYGLRNDLKGVVFRVHGKFQGVLRKRRFFYAYGKTSTSALNTYVNYTLKKSYTRFGVFSIKV